MVTSRYDWKTVKKKKWDKNLKKQPNRIIKQISICLKDFFESHKKEKQMPNK